MTDSTRLIDGLPEPKSFWVDTESGYLYQYRGICKKGVFKDRLEFKSYYPKTNTFSEEGGLYLGRQRFKEDMKPMGELALHPCCGCPTLYPIVWCDDCGYETWSAARDKKENAA